MALAPPVKLDVRSRPTTLRGEMAIRYGAAYASTLTSIAATATLPSVPRSFVLLLLVITLLGLPVSLGLRLSGLRLGTWQIPRFLLAALVSAITVVMVLFIVVQPLQERTGAGLLSPDFFRAFFYRHDADDAILVVLQVISLIMVCRCLVVITDKDAVLCTVPAFCVLVLLIVVERQPGVVAFFLLWAVTASVLFALDHRQEVSRHATVYVPALLPGQNTALSARTLGGVMAFSLLCAAILSYTVTSRIDNRSSAEGWISSMAMKLTQFATALPEVSVNAGPERQIDFTSGPALPTRSPLWLIGAQDIRTGQFLTPAYWRMFTLSRYNGSSWMQSDDPALRVPIEKLGNVGLVRPLPLRPDPASYAGGVERSLSKGFDVARYLPRGPRSQLEFGAPVRAIRVRVTARQANIGFVPHLPAPHYLSFQNPQPDYLSVFPDRGLDARFIEASQGISIVCDVASGEDYGVPGDGPPRKTGASPNSRLRLTRRERQIYLQLPDTKLDRVAAFAKTTLQNAAPDDSNYAKALRLARALQRGATYTLRPPALPPGRDATDFFLFESRRGYCTYFAGALTVLCRASGIPARVVEGFTAGERRGSSFSYLVRESNAHAWTEIWVPGWGWATVDATPPAERGDNAADWWTQWADALTSVMDGAKLWIARHRMMIIIMLSAVLMMGVVFFHERATLPARRLAALRLTRRRVSDRTARLTIDEVYERAAHTLQKRFRARTSWETPHEWLNAAQAALHLRDTAPLHRLTDLYVQAHYSPRELGAEESQDAWRALSRISWESETQ